ncbi:MAG: tRNA lysidine(34) synthetase TilS [Bacteroidota bacterium]
MEQELLKFIHKNDLFSSESQILVAVSGGVDSVVLLNLLAQLKFNISVAHCNFQLRAEESEQDMGLVMSLAEELEVPCYTKRFDVKEYTLAHKTSIQIAARNLRYQWFRNILIENKIDYLATAHHLNDSIETTLFNLTKGTGISGLKGIPVKNDWIVRPLLCFTKENILAYAEKEKLKWREDLSNSENKYSRNLIRNEVIPNLKNINLSLEETFKSTIQRLNQTERIYKEYIQLKKREIIQKQEKCIAINKFALLSFTEPLMLLFETIEEYGFNYQQAEDIISGIEQSGSLFYSNSHQLNIDRDSIIIEQIDKQKIEPIEISTLLKEVKTVLGSLSFDIIPKEGYEIEKSPDIAALDYDKISLPITIRPWGKGDKITPIGMNNQKKLSDLLIDEKIPILQKQKTLVLETNGEIAWVIGLRISDNFKITSPTKKVLRLQIRKD